MDNAQKETEKRLKQIENRIKSIYKSYLKDIGTEWKEYLEKAGGEIKSYQESYEKALKSGDKKEIKSKKKALDDAKTKKTITNSEFKKKTEELCERLLETSKIAIAYLNDELPKIYEINYNHFKNTASSLKGYSFSLVDANTIKNLAKSDKTLLPYKVIDDQKNIRWNTRKINSEVMQGIILGEKIGDIANRLQKVEEMNEADAIKNARTAVTSAQGKGRQDSYEKAEKDGIILKKEWLSSNGVRTRMSHRNKPIGVGGELVEPDELFSNGLLYPGDPNGKPEEVYNCRCCTRAKIIGFKRAKK